MPELPDPVTYAVPAFILLLIAEMIISLRADKSRYEARDTLTSLMLGTGSQGNNRNMARKVWEFVLMTLSISTISPEQ